MCVLVTGETEMAAELREMYGDIEAVEFYVGLMVEKHRHNSMFGGTVVEVGGPFSVKGLMSPAICSPTYWKPSTFGGQVGFDMVKSATLKKLFCNNMQGECPDVGFKVPSFREKTEVTPENSTADFYVTAFVIAVLCGFACLVTLTQKVNTKIIRHSVHKVITNGRTENNNNYKNSYNNSDKSKNVESTVFQNGNIYHNHRS